MPANAATAIRTNGAAGDSAASRFPLEQFCRAMETRDYDGVLGVASDDFLFAPLGTDKIKFRGEPRVRSILRGLLETCDSFRYTGEMYTSEDTIVLPLRCVSGSIEVNAVDFLKIDERGKMTEMVVYGRPYMAVSVLVGRVGMAVIRQGGFATWLFMHLLIKPLEWSQRLGEPIGTWFVTRGMDKGLKRSMNRRNV